MIESRLSKLCSMTEVNQNFSKIARKIDVEGNVIVLKNNKPRYLILDIEQMKKNDELSVLLEHIK